ncbi:MAG: hypothetical protein AAF329_01760 [Cyanobacteria bacterium P01_A01_bin.17]
MTLVPCNVCGTLNSEDTEICLSCEFPVKGRRRPVIFQWAALLLLLPFVITGLSLAFNWLRPQRPPSSPAEKTARLITASHRDRLFF